LIRGFYGCVKWALELYGGWLSIKRGFPWNLRIPLIFTWFLPHTIVECYYMACWKHYAKMAIYLHT
jgi:hypothetical protein